MIRYIFILSVSQIKITKALEGHFQVNIHVNIQVNVHVNIHVNIHVKL